MPVFLDPTRRRWAAFLLVSATGFVGVASVLGAASASIVRGFDPLSVALIDPPGITEMADASLMVPAIDLEVPVAGLPLAQPDALSVLPVDPIVTAAIDVPLAATEAQPPEPAAGDPVAVAAPDAEPLRAPTPPRRPEGLVAEPGPTFIETALDAETPNDAIPEPLSPPMPLPAEDDRMAVAALDAQPVVAPIPPPRPAGLVAEPGPDAPGAIAPETPEDAVPQPIVPAPAPRIAVAAVPAPAVQRTSPSVQILGATKSSVQTLRAPQGGASSSIQILSSAPQRPIETLRQDTARSGASLPAMILGAILDVVVSPANAQEFSPQPTPEIYAFHVNWDVSSQSSLHENILKIDTLLPEWVRLADVDGAIAIDRSLQTEQVLELIAGTAPDLRVVPVLTDFAEETAQTERVISALASPAARAALVANLLSYVEESGFAGIAVRFSQVERLDPLSLTLLLGDLEAAFAPQELAVYVVLPMEQGLAHAPMAARHVDGVILGGWGETRSGYAPGPLASQDWFETLLPGWREAVPAEQLVFGLRNMAYDWSDRPVASQVSVLGALNRARAAGAAVGLDAASLNTRFHYSDDAGRLHEVWMLDAVSAFNQLGAVMDTPPRGLALDRLGTEDAAIWDLLAAPAAPSPESLEVIDYRYQIARYGSGEIIRLGQEPVPGARTVALRDGLVTAADIAVFPRAWEIVHWGSSDSRLVALTFDDGPDPVYTPAILDILAQYEVPATFFAVGAQMLRHPGIVERIVDEGHEVGSHTYSHTNIARMSPQMLRIDLNATQRVFEGITGRNLAFFRAPYAVDANPRTPSEIAPLATVGDLGYLTVNMNIDPRDWWAPDADRIAAATVRGVESGLGNIVLLHDGGGNRSHTVAALPRIIAELQDQGYRFVAVSELIGLDADAVMPPTLRPAGWLATLENFGLALLAIGEKLLVTLFLVAVALGIARALVLIVLSTLRRRHRVLPADQAVMGVSVIVPAHNEEKVIEKTVRSLLASTYSNMEIIIVDDGSTDRTLAVCRAAFSGHPRVTIHTRPNGGKAAALDYGFARARAEIVVALDADTIFAPETIGWLAAHFADPRVGAVAGNAKVGNRINLLTRWQAVEYITAQNLDRRAFEVLNCITVVPGAVGAWRRGAVLATGGYRTDTLAEDADLTIRLLRAGHRVVYEERAVALTEAPETAGQLFKQRFRWMFGMLQVAFKHKDALLLRDSKSVPLVALPNILLFQILFPLVAPIADIVALLTLGDLAVKLATESNLLGLDQTLTFLALFFAFILLDLLAAIIAFANERREDWRLLFWLPFQRFYYRQLLYLVAIKAVLTAIRGTLVGWGSLVRTASVKLEGA